MAGRHRYQSSAEALRPTLWEQDDFSGGVNIDEPASALGPGELAAGENIICFPKWFTGRPGTTRYAQARLPGTGTFHSWLFHPSTRLFYLHRGNYIWWCNASMTGAIPGADPWTYIVLNVDADSSMLALKDAVLVCTPSGIFRVKAGSPDPVQMNAPGPNVRLGAAGVAQTHEYRYLYTFIRRSLGTGDRLTAGQVIEYESSSPALNANNLVDYGDMRPANAVSPTTPITLRLSQQATANASTDLITVAEAWVDGTVVRVGHLVGTLPAPLAVNTDYWVTYISATTIKLSTSAANRAAGVFVDLTNTGSGHTWWVYVDLWSRKPVWADGIALYRTGDLGEGVVDPETNTGNNSEVYTWVGDFDLQISSTAPVTLTDTVSDDVWRARTLTGGFGLRTRQWAAIPSGQLAAMDGGWFFVAALGGNILSYSQIADAGGQGASLGYHFPGYQFQRFDDAIQALLLSPDLLTVGCLHSTHLVRLTAYTNKGLLELISVLSPSTRASERIGVRDWKAVASTGVSSFVALCSDASIREWDGNQWGRDLSFGKIKTDVRQFAAGVVFGYWQGALYVWFRRSSSAGYLDECWRLALEEEAGRGWTKCTGTNWIYPPLNVPGQTLVDGNGIQRLVVLDSASEYFYWIETFAGYSGSGVAQASLDRAGEPGLCPLGSTYWHDALDNNALASDLVAVTVGGAFIQEANGALFLICPVGTDRARVIVNRPFSAAGDFDLSIDLTRWIEYGPPARTVKYELKVAAFATNTTDIDVGALTADGIYLYGEVIDDTANTWNIYWKAKKGAVEYQGNLALTGYETTIRIIKTGTTIAWHGSGALNGELDSDTRAEWATFGTFKAALSFQVSDNIAWGFGFNNFLLVAPGMPSSCIGTDGLGSDTVPGRGVAWRVRFREVTGRQEAWRARTQEAHAYLRPRDEASGYPSAFAVTAKGYVDGSTSPVESITGAPYRGDITFFKEQEGRRLQLELTGNVGDFRCTGVDLAYLVEDRRHPAQNITGTAAYAAQRDLGQALRHWFARPDFALDRAAGAKATASGAALAQVTGPDGKAKGGVTFGASSALSRAVAQSYGDFAIAFWAKSPVLNQDILRIAGATPLYVQFASGTSLRVAGFGTVTIANAQDGAWHFYAITRVGTAITVYQDGAQVGTLTGSGTLGGGALTVGGAISGASLADLRVYSAAKAAASLVYLYQDTALNAGKLVLPHG